LKGGEREGNWKREKGRGTSLSGLGRESIIVL
jgi:hypothetical protein